MLDNIIKYGYIDNPSHNIPKTLRQLLSYVHQFHQIVHKLTLDDIAAFEWEEIQQKVKFINTTFDKELKYINGVLYRLN
jgi:flagellar biosynthesis chaperone FliJ